jgi:hypothetical protein
MATEEDRPIPLRLPRDEATALSQFVKRVDYETCARFASVELSARNGIAVWRNVRDLESEGIAISPFAAGTGYRAERTGADGHGHDGR